MHTDVLSPAQTVPALALRPEGDLWKQVQSAIGCALRLLSAHEIDGADGRMQVLVVEKNQMLDTALLRRRFRLTSREAEIARLLAERLTNNEIAMELGISVHTVRHHVEQVMSKLNVSSRNDVRAKLIPTRAAA